MKTADYLNLDEDGRAAAFRAARDAAETFEFEAAKLLLADAAEEIRKYWPDAVAAVLETNPHEHFYALSGVQAADQRLLWTRRDGLVDPSKGNDDELWDLAYEIGRTIQDARELRANILEEIEGAVWHYAFILDHWLTPEDDDEPDAPAGSTVYLLRNHDDLFAYGSAEARTRHEAQIARGRWDEIVDDDLPAGRFDVDEVPAEPPADDALAAEMFREATEEGGDSYHPETDTLTVLG